MPAVFAQHINDYNTSDLTHYQRTELITRPTKKELIHKDFALCTIEGRQERSVTLFTELMKKHSLLGRCSRLV